MNKRARAARAAEETQAQDAALDHEIEVAALPLRVTPTDVVRFEDALPAAALVPLTPRRAAALLTSLRRATSSPPPTTIPIPTTFGDLLRHGRERARLDVSDVARRLHVHRDYLSGIESGVRSPLALGPDGARRLVALLALPPAATAAALEAAMIAALAPTVSTSARMKRGVPRDIRRRILEDALPTGPEKAHLHEWRTLIDAVSELGE